MVNKSANVVAGKPKVSGGVYIGPLGTALPTDASTALDASLKSLGYAGDAGLVQTQSRDVNGVNAWGGDHVADLQTAYTETYKVTLIESLNPDVNKAVYGDGAVTVTAANGTHGAQLAIARSSAMLPTKVWVFDMGYGTYSRRVALPIARITDVGDISYTDGDVIAYEVTITCYADENGNFSYEYTDDGLVATGS